MELWLSNVEYSRHNNNEDIKGVSIIKVVEISRNCYKKRATRSKNSLYDIIEIISEYMEQRNKFRLNSKWWIL